MTPASTVTPRTATEGIVLDPLADQPPLLPVPKAAQILGISRASAYRYASAGDLPTRRLGGRVYVITARLRDLIEGAEGVAA